MSIFERKPVLRWLTPLAFVGVVAGGAGVYTTATATTPLPKLTPEQLLVKVQQAKVDGLSGTITQTADLGLPSIPGVGGSDDAQLTSLASGTHTLDVWYAGTDKTRLRVQAAMDESDVIVNGRHVWNWSFKDKKATHRVLPAANSKQHSKAKLPADLPKTPAEAAKQALAAVNPTTAVTMERASTVAGRDAYQLVLSPKDAGSRIAQVKIAVDGQKYVPLQVEVISNKDDSVFKVGYTKIDFTRPADSEFTFNPPAGTKVTTVKQSALPRQHGSAKAEDKRAAAAKAAQPKVYGHGWSSVVVSKMGTNPSQVTGQAAQVLNKLPKVQGAWGTGRLLDTKVITAVLTDDGRVAAGAVNPDRLYAALNK